MKRVMTLLVFPALISACGGGGGGGGIISPPPSSVGTIIYGPYETVYGQACQSSEPIPGCTFDRLNGTRVTVNADPHYDRYGYQSDDLWYVSFDSSGNARVYDDLGNYRYTTRASSFAGWVGGTTIGVGTTGLFWENVSGGSYWLGKNGVLYSANTMEGNFGEAINSEDSQDAADTNFAAITSAANKSLIKAGAAKLVSEYGFAEEKAVAVASALNSWAVAGAERGYTTDRDMDKTFKSVFGVEYGSALAAVKDLMGGDTSSMRDLTDRSAAALGLKPEDAQRFMKGMYKKALSNWGYDVDSVNW
jgi:hypothetical protein